MLAPRKQFALIYAPILKQHLRHIDPRHFSLIRESLQEQLQFQPDIETKNRKPLKRPALSGAKWEIRFGPENRFRAFYRIDFDQHQVVLLAVGEKIGNRLLIGGEEVEI